MNTTRVNHSQPQQPTVGETPEKEIRVRLGGAFRLPTPATRIRLGGAFRLPVSTRQGH